jgi:hypothetical protein
MMLHQQNEIFQKNRLRSVCSGRESGIGGFASPALVIPSSFDYTSFTTNLEVKEKQWRNKEFC